MTIVLRKQLKGGDNAGFHFTHHQNGDSLIALLTLVFLLIKLKINAVVPDLWRKNIDMSLLLSLSSRLAHLLQCRRSTPEEIRKWIERIATLAKDILSSFNSASSSPMPHTATPKSLRSWKPSRVNRGFSLCGRHQISVSSTQCPTPFSHPCWGLYHSAYTLTRT